MKKYLKAEDSNAINISNIDQLRFEFALIAQREECDNMLMTLLNENKYEIKIKEGKIHV